jgi:ferrous iron transport protein A
VRLSDLPKNASATIIGVEESQATNHAGHLSHAGKQPTSNIDTIARRLKELGFVPGEQVRLITVAPFGGDPILVQIGFTRFALRRSEAIRVVVEGVST